MTVPFEIVDWNISGVTVRVTIRVTIIDTYWCYKGRY